MISITVITLQLSTSMVVDPGSVKIYTVDGAVSGSSSSLPDWLTLKGAAN
jgi:hypothetical protein